MRYIEVTQDLIDFINSDEWRGEDFTAYEFNRNQSFRGRTDFGQVFTPDHICGLLAKLLKINKDDRVLDASCGSGALLMKSLYFMIKDAKETLTGDILEEKLEEIKTKQIFGIEIDSQVANLARDNLEAIKGGKSNIITEDASSEKAAQFIREHNITKAILNPPYEEKFKSSKIIQNVLDNVPAHTLVGFILPSNKFNVRNLGNKQILPHHTLKLVVQLPQDIFFKVNVHPSIFIFETGVPQGDKPFFGIDLQDDGFVTDRKKGRFDTKNKWPAIEKQLLEDIETGEEIENRAYYFEPSEQLSFYEKHIDLTPTEEDFMNVVSEYLAWKVSAVLKGEITLEEVQNEKNMSELR